MPLKIYNNAYALFGAAVNPGDVAIALAVGQGARIPLALGEWTYGTIVKPDGSLEVIKINTRSADNLTVVRGQDGTAALTISASDISNGARLELRPCAAAINDIMANSVDVSRKAVLVGTDTYTGTLSPVITAYSQVLHLVQFPNANTVTNPTLNLNALGAKSLKNRDGAALSVGDIKAASWHLAYYDGTNFNLLTIPAIDTSALVPAGTIIHTAQNTAPTGFLKANGAAVSRTTYATLFATIGTTFGVGDGSTTFNLPDLRGEFVRGWDDARGIDSGRVFGSLQTDAFQGHWHELRADGSGAGSGGGYMGLQSGGSSLMAQAVKAPNTDGVNGTPRTAAETRPRNVALLACIKY